MIKVAIDPSVSNLTVGLVEGRGLTISPSNEPLREYCQSVVATVIQEGLAGGENRRAAVRALLRAGGFKPAGRNKPAQEYLLRTVTEQEAIPSIYNAVDLINAVSLASGLPISLVALERVPPALLIRYGKAGESYIFNPSGQELDVEGLICVCSHDDHPWGSPVKDSMNAKVNEDDADVVACVFAPSDCVEREELLGTINKLQEGFRNWCDADQTEAWLLP